jgi:F-type H+-transporting ATPase subunit delta
MTPRALARQYAGALFDVAQKQSRLEQARRDIGAFAAVVSSHDELRSILQSSAIPVPQKKALVSALLGAMADLTDEVRRLVSFLADHDRLMFLDDIVAAFEDRAMEAERVIKAEVTTAGQLAAGAKTELASALSKATGRQVTMTEHVDAAIIGGIVAKVGSVVFDGSVARQIERLRERLLAET